MLALLCSTNQYPPAQSIFSDATMRRQLVVKTMARRGIVGNRALCLPLSPRTFREKIADAIIFRHYTLLRAAYFRVRR